jgi:ATP-dependent DNA helicase RecG
MSKMSQATTSTATSTADSMRSATAERAGEHMRAFATTRELSRQEMIDAPVRWPRPSRLQTPLQAAAGKMAEGMETLGLRTVGELLEHLPRDSREARTVLALRPGEQATVAVQVRAIGARSVRRRGMRPLVEARVFDATGTMRATFFNQPWLVQRYPPGTRLLLHGKADGRGGFRVSHHAAEADAGPSPAGSGVDPGPAPGAGDLGGGGRGGELRRDGAGAVVAHYPAAEGVTSTQILTLVQGARDALADVTEALSAATRVTEVLPDRASALAAMHFPQDAEDPETGRERLAFEELLLMQLVFLRRRARRRARTGACVLDEEPSLSGRWLQGGLPFALTGDQHRTIEAIRGDLREPRAMQRLLMGEVGSGKTVVALYAMLRAVEHGHQAALMAPTETLAEQHFATLQGLLGAEPVAAALLTGSTPARRREDILGKLASGELSLVVGTHALIEPDVRFAALAVAVVDEQHRFGVRQRTALEEKGTPHMLHMTATPIPRTLALAEYGDLDVSTLRELPRGRQTIDTRVVAGESARERAYEMVREQLRAGRQAYVVCPLIEEAEVFAPREGSTPAGGGERSEAHGPDGWVGQRAATAELKALREGELKGYELMLLHGGMRPREKQEAMAAFASGKADVLVATTVIEVGIDVANATVMLVENAERFGISQLHQLRGRVGRGEHRASCLLMGPPGSARLRALVEHSDGFRLAEIDLGLRKEGELVGTRQSGFGQFLVACLPEDASLLERARARAEAIVAVDPDLQMAEHVLLGDALERRFGAEALEPIPA